MPATATLTATQRRRVVRVTTDTEGAYVGTRCRPGHYGQDRWTDVSS